MITNPKIIGPINLNVGDSCYIVRHRRSKNEKDDIVHSGLVEGPYKIKEYKQYQDGNGPVSVMLEGMTRYVSGTSIIPAKLVKDK
jgi:hypothetical protein